MTENSLAEDAKTRAAVERLRSAAVTGSPVAPVRDLIGRDDVEASYAVQSQLVAERIAAGAQVVGRKIGLTSKAVQAQLGVDQPDFGFLFDDMAYADAATIAYDSIMQPRVEAEVAFILGADLAEGPLDEAQVRAAIAFCIPALEICGSRIANWDISFADTVADNASAGGFVFGLERTTLSQFDPAAVEMSMSIDGTEVSTGSGADCLGDPINAVVWLARQARELGAPLRSGQVILSGALGPMRPVMPGNQVVATLSGLGSVSVRFGDSEKEEKA